MSRKVALFPISLSNQSFSTDVVLPLLPNVFARYDCVVFLVADRLQIYNKAMRVGDGEGVRRLIGKFEIEQSYVEQRTAWLERLTALAGAPASSGKWLVRGVEDFSDEKCFRIFRNVMLAYYTLDAFRSDIDEAALQHGLDREDVYPVERIIQLSKGYILEEIAVSLRIRVCESIRDEFYLGKQAEPVLRLYSGAYGIHPEELASVDAEGGPWRFFSLEESVRWKEVTHS